MCVSLFHSAQGIRSTAFDAHAVDGINPTISEMPINPVMDSNEDLEPPPMIVPPPMIMPNISQRTCPTGPVSYMLCFMCASVLFICMQCCHIRQ